uniref:chaperone protein dnaJ 49-like n=1 Tax=Erigeron canadensis TaxID=72917 RepID=UPI001CB946E1|nr:chaperone protein dnaJ 49-like [Erigeron canadensis]
MEAIDDFNTAYEKKYHNRTTILPGSSDDDKHHVAPAVNEDDAKITIPSSFFLQSTNPPQVFHFNQQRPSSDHTYRSSRSTQQQQQRRGVDCRWRDPVLCLLFCLVCICAVLGPLWYYLGLHCDPYSLHKEAHCRAHLRTKEYRIKFYVKSRDKFNHKYPEGTPARAQIENTIVTNYIKEKRRDCIQERWDDETYIPDCDDLKKKGLPVPARDDTS